MSGHEACRELCRVRRAHVGQRPNTSQPRATPWGPVQEWKSPERAAQPLARMFRPFRACTLPSVTQGVALGWLVLGLWPTETAHLKSA